jgi:hypothetical protein
MTTRQNDFEYPDIAGYPDGMGFLDEGTATREVDTETHDEKGNES